MNPYETRKQVDEYLLFHYGSSEEILEWEFGPSDALDFAVRTVEETFDWSKIPASARALDIGCAVGRSSFELSKRCAHVVGIDYSMAFIRAAETIRQEGEIAYERLEEAGRSSECVARLAEGTPSGSVHFEQGDAMDLPPDLGVFDVVHGANLLCRLHDPLRFLERLPDLVKSEGQLVLTTPCTWLEAFTPRENWPEHSTLDYLQEHLGCSFILTKRMDMPFLIREHRRKFQWTVAEASVWLRR